MGKLYDTYHTQLNAIANGRGAATAEEIKALFGVVDALIERIDGPTVQSPPTKEELQKLFTTPKPPAP